MKRIYGCLTVLDCLAPLDGDSARQCLRRADLCSRFAKCCRGQTQKKLYRLKNLNIRTALSCPTSDVEVVVDRDRYFGLLSVRLNGTDGLRVHSHENWIDAA